MMLQYKILKYKTILHSIPIGSIIALLLLFSFLISPNIYYSNNSVYAAEDNNVNNSINNTSTHANDTESSTSLIIGGAEMNEVVDASVGEVAYRKHTVTISASKLKSYTLFISGPEGLSGDTTITGANGNTPTDMPKNSWGYAYGQDGSENDMTYSSFTNNAELIDSKLESESTEDDTDSTKNLIFAVKFGNAIAGHYTGTVTLSLAAEPKEVTSTGFGGITNMQDMTASVCNAVSIGDTGTLLDIRDNNEYSVAKLEDGRCWMTQNLRITGDSLVANGNTDRLITFSDSNINSDYAVPISRDDLWAGGDGNMVQRVYYSGTDITDGAYYSWCAATAGSCNNAATANSIAKYSVCPKGWRLPSNSEYATLIGIGYEKVDNNLDDSTFEGYNIAGSFFPASGNIYNHSISGKGLGGHYWSSVASSNEGAYGMYFNDSVAIVSGLDKRYYGFPVRCIAMKPEDEENVKNTPVDNWVDVEYMQQMSPQACESAGTAGTNNYPSKTLKDSRDDNTYIVTKLDDQKCWMTQNLKLNLSLVSLTSANSNVSNANPLKWNGGSDTTLSSSSSGFSSGTESVAKWNDGTGFALEQEDNTYNSSYGYYYNWLAASAGSSRNSGVSSTSICPKGWKLPSDTEYNNLITKAGLGGVDGSTIIQNAPYYFPAAGFIDGGTLRIAGSGGRYWTSSIYDDKDVETVFFDGVSVYYVRSSRRYGYSVRCVTK